jgi:hypothetical protein
MKFNVLDASAIAEAVAENGFAIAEAVLSSDHINYLVKGCGLSELVPAVHRQRNAVFGVRDALNTIPLLKRFANQPPLMTLAQLVLGRNARPVRAIMFDKTPEANWKVPWHQDMTIAVKERKNVPGFDAWTSKAGIPHVEAPVTLLEGMVTLRLHLDDCNADNGALMVIPGSHRSGKLGPALRTALVARSKAVTCAVCAGDVLLMQPLLLHRSSPARRPEHRRVLHFEYSSDTLPGGLKWRE